MSRAIRKPHPSPLSAIQLKAAIEDDSLSFSEQEELMGETDCPKGCTVEADGECPHGYESAALTAGVI